MQNLFNCKTKLKEFFLVLLCALIAFITASCLMSGLTEGLRINTSYPYSYHGDGLYNSFLIERIKEGWVFSNDRSGFPFGSLLYDFPNSDLGSFLFVKILFIFFTDFSQVINLYFLLSFPIIFIVSFYVCKEFHLNTSLSVISSFIFTFLPFHFDRLNHLFYTLYFVVPIYFLFSYKLFKNDLKINVFLMFLISILLSFFGIYYTLFGCIILGAGTLLGLFSNKDPRILKQFFVIIASLTIGTAINVSPNLIYIKQNNANTGAIVRTVQEGELYGLKFIQLILPRDNHRYQDLSVIKANYNATHPLVNENTISSLGVLGSLGFIIVWLIAFISSIGIKVDKRIGFLSAISIILFLFGTIGGLGSIFSTYVSPLIRGWNRISIFIGFSSILVLALLAQSKIKNRFLLVMLCLLIPLALYDQTPRTCHACNSETQIEYRDNSDFIAKIEKSLPIGAGIYQLPYMSFPESPPIYKLADYELLIGFLHSKHLKWSYGSVKGREADKLYKELSTQPLEEQIEAIRTLGFKGVYIDTRGFADNGTQILKDANKLLAADPIIHRNNLIYFYKID